MNWLRQYEDTVCTGRVDAVMEDTTEDYNRSQNSSNERPGKFPELSDFMTAEGYEPREEPGTQAPVNAGDIIYIRDPSAKDTRINDRIMLVLYHNWPFSFTCLSFCRYQDFSGGTLEKSHAIVYTDRCQQMALQLAQAEQPNSSLLRLKIHLGHNAISYSLEPDIYLNLREHWNIEQEVRLVMLGRVDKSSYKKLVPKIERLFSQSLNSADLLGSGENLPAPDEEESASKERKSRKHNDKGSVPKEREGKKKNRSG